jgi:cell wall-associated NlpC family hydrolase
MKKWGGEEMTQADKFRAETLSERGYPYVWGGTAYINGKPCGTDCSGLEVGCLRESGVLWHGAEFPRWTADGLLHAGKRISAPSMVGADAAYLLIKGTNTAHHVECYIGEGQIVQAIDPALGIRLTTVAQTNAEHCVWSRLPIDLGVLTPPPAPGPPTPPPLRAGGLFLTSPYMSGSDVHYAQVQLAKAGLYLAVVDGVFGPKTSAAVVSFKKRMGVVPDGIVGPTTYAALEALK